MEREIQYVVRHVVADYVEDENEELALDLRAGRSPGIELLRERLEEAAAAWSKKYSIVAIRHDQFHWMLKPSLIESPDDGPLVKFEWGWGAGDPDQVCPSVTSSGGAAFDLAVEILELFTDDTGEPHRPTRPEREEAPHSPEFSRLMDDFHKGATEFMEALGDKGGCSMDEVRAWIAAGKPTPPTPHVYVQYPEDHVAVCSVCGHWYSTREQSDDYPTRVCAERPATEGQSIHNFDPRRSPQLREAQRLDRLTQYMAKLEATPPEVEPFLLRLRAAEEALETDDRARYDKERVGLTEDGRRRAEEAVDETEEN